MKNSVQPNEIIIIKDTDRKGAPWARNRGAEQVHGEFLVFSDDDISWEINALKQLYEGLERTPGAAYAYGWYMLGTRTIPSRVFDLDVLKTYNYISTMSMIRRDLFEGFDEEVKRYQDWDLWLTMAEAGKFGVYVDALIFKTTVDKQGLSVNNVSDTEARRLLATKHPFVWASRRVTK
jgi:glycosyltransferase involved in cell wall biosynthesis